jgi:hypothetical protein
MQMLLLPLDRGFVVAAADSNQKIFFSFLIFLFYIRRFLVLVLWQGRIQAEHMGVVREITEIYYKKGGRRLQAASLSGGMEVLCAGKKEEEFCCRSFLCHP